MYADSCKFQGNFSKIFQKSQKTEENQEIFRVRQYSTLAHVRRTSKGKADSRTRTRIPLLWRGGSGRRRVSRRFSRNSLPLEGRLWEAARLASLLRNSSPSEGRLWEAARLASLLRNSSPSEGRLWEFLYSSQGGKLSKF